jgi:type I restriction enzyme S subunit
MYGQGDTAGRVAINKIPLTTNQACCNLTIDESKADYEFIYYQLCTLYNKMVSLKAGAAQPNLNAQIIKNLDLLLPSLPMQYRIATILSRYDSLIENCQKQIKLLEEAAQRLYKEWFVDLHFPGHEKTKIVDGVPKGWEKKPVDSIYSIKYGKNLSTKLIAESGKYPVYGANGVIGYCDKYNCSEQVVLITSRGNGSGNVLMTYHKDAFITNNSFIVSPLKEYSYCQVPFTYLFLKNANFRSVRTGAAQPQLTNQSIHTVDVVLPSKDIIISFCNVLSHNNGMVIGLKNQIHLLVEARDRLLPNLMNENYSFQTQEGHRYA